MDLIALQRSAEFDDIETQLKALFMSLYTQYIDAGVTELECYGMPHIGSSALIERYIAGDGLAVLRTTTDDQIRQLFLAWKFNNPKRGTAFLRAYLTALFGSVFTVDQLWCPKTGAYPTDAVSKAELLADGDAVADYFLTSRLRVDIQTTIVPSRILAAAKTAVGAKFVLELRAALGVTTTMALAFPGFGVQIFRSTGKAVFQQPPTISTVTAGAATRVGASTLTFSPPRKVNMHTGV